MTDKTKAKAFDDFMNAVGYFQKHKPEKASLFRFQTSSGEYFCVATTAHRAKLALVDHLLTAEPSKMSLTEMFDRMLDERLNESNKD